MGSRLTGLVALGCALVIACSQEREKPERRVVPAAQYTPKPGDRVTGSLVVDGTPVTDLACRPGARVHIFIEVVTSRGVLRLEDATLSWNDQPLSCDQLDRSWGGGRRPGNDAYWRGTLAFRCAAGVRTFVGDLDIDCGGITPDERAQLDAKRTGLQDEQRDAGPR